ncbi:GyrI-like domain-containing protein [Ancylobacter dichloromethanicus]|nr:GyrI-like domain-containing protein [Ancylobacter dichloromethanicus]
MMMVKSSARARPCRLFVARALAGALLFMPLPLLAQTRASEAPAVEGSTAAAPPAPAADPSTPAADAAPDTQAPDTDTPDTDTPDTAGPLDEDDMVAPPMVDPRAVETRNVAPAPDPLTRPDGFGDETVMQPVPVLMKKAHAGWDDAFRTIVATLKQIDAEMARLKLKASGASFIIYTSTDDLGFDFEAAVPFEGATTEKPQNGVAFAASPAGRALRFTHRGPYDAMDPTYEQIANLLDAKDLEAQDLYVEEYRSDPRTTSPDDLVIDIWVPLK